jgi:CheY-like chemotaxis protein
LERLDNGCGGPDLIIADYHLGAAATGLDAIGRIQAALRRQVPALLITADHSAELHRAVAGRGYPLLNKPVKPAQLRSLLTHLLSGAYPSPEDAEGG